MINNLFPKTKQHAMFLLALRELQLPCDDIKIDHPNARNMWRNQSFNLTIPASFIAKAAGLIPPEKNINYNFQGLMTPRRAWVERFRGPAAVIENTRRGRGIFTKFKFDTSYYALMAHTKFTLCPSGDFEWSYRFLEAIMCLSIPIIEARPSHPMLTRFTSFLADEPHEFDPSICERNYNVLINEFTLFGQLIGRRTAQYSGRDW